MKVLVCALGLWATIALAQFDLSTLEQSPERQQIPSHAASGFGGYGFGSSRDFVRTGRAHDRHMLDREYAEWIWYIGTIEDCGMESGYQFDGRDKLIGGLWVIKDTRECFDKVHERLIDVYGGNLEMVINGSTVKIEMWIPHTQIIHRKNANGHTVSFYDTFDRTQTGGP